MSLPTTMTAVVLTGHGGYDKLDYRTDVATPSPAPGEVLIEVAAAGVNNTDVNTRTAWYSKSVTEATGAGGRDDGFSGADDADGSWSGAPLEFPRIQGADCCGRIVAVGEGVAEERLGQRVLVRTMQDHPTDDRPMIAFTFGSECDGAFAQYTTARSGDALAVDCDWTDVELASIPCAWSTAEGMLQRGAVGAERVLITGASGGVGSAAVQLARRRGAEVVAVCGATKAEQVAALGASQVLDRDTDLAAALGAESVDVVLDVVAGAAFPALLDILTVGGRYVTSGAIAGPIVDLDVRTLYLKDLSLLGSTYQPPRVFEDLIGYIERGEVFPVVAAIFPLEEIVAAQAAFMTKEHVGKIVLVPPGKG